MPTSSQALSQLRSGDPTHASRPPCPSVCEDLDILQMANIPSTAPAVSTLTPDKCLLTRANLHRTEVPSCVETQRADPCVWPYQNTFSMHGTHVPTFISAEAQGDVVKLYDQPVDQPTLPAIGSVHAHTGQVISALAQANKHRSKRNQVYVKELHDRKRIVDSLLRRQIAAANGPDDAEHQIVLSADFGCNDGVRDQYVSEADNECIGGLADPRLCQSPKQFAFTNIHNGMSKTCPPPPRYGGDNRVNNTAASSVSSYGAGPDSIIYKPCLPGFYSNGGVGRHVSHGGLHLAPGNMRPSASGDGENQVRLMDDSQPLLGSDVVQCLTSVSKGACGVLTFNTNTGRHEWKLLDSCKDTAVKKDGLRGNRRKASTKPGKQTLPSGLWVSPYEKMERIRDEKERSRFRSLPSILDLSLRVGKGIGVTGVLDVRGKHISLPGECGFTDAAFIGHCAGQLPRIPQAEDLTPPHRGFCTQINAVSCEQIGAASYLDPEENCQDSQHPQPSPGCIVIPRVVIRNASLASGTDHDQASELEETVIGDDMVQNSMAKSEHKETGTYQTEPLRKGTKKNVRRDNMVRNHGKDRTARDQCEEREGNISKDDIAKEKGPNKDYLQVPKWQGTEGWTQSGDDWHSMEPAEEVSETCQGEFSMRLPRSGPSSSGYLYCRGSARSDSYCSSDGGWTELKWQDDAPNTLREFPLPDLAGRESERSRLKSSTLCSSRPHSPHCTEKDFVDTSKDNEKDVNFSACALTPGKTRRLVTGPNMDSNQAKVQAFMTGGVPRQIKAESLIEAVKVAQDGNDFPDTRVGQVSSLVVPPPFSKSEIRRLAASPAGDKMTPIRPTESLSGTRFLRRFNNAVLRMRKELPPPDSSKLCFQSNIPGCSHAEILECLEASFSDIKVASLQYDPIHLQDYRDPLNSGLRFKCMWLFTLTPESDSTKLLLRGFRLRGQRMNIRRADDVYAEEQRAFSLCWEMLHRGLVGDAKGEEDKEVEQFGKLNNSVYRAAERKPTRGSRRNSLRITRTNAAQPTVDRQVPKQKQGALQFL